ncbi:MAG: putative phosphate transport protein (TIGR00153 family) [Haliea salexigens]|jgi:predicted phosphate transport protein (TIGR00153 family)|tara:strand:- start:1252 stop:1866 length:615 start_codon:yes stop_codon:yes gene_type:complete
MQVANDAAQLLPAFLEAAQDDDWKLAEEIFKRIGEAEEAADKLKRSVRRHLPNSLFLPVPRTDLLELVTIQDHVANTAKDIAGLMLGREMRFPEKLEKHLLEFARACTATCEQALVAIRELDELLEVGFTGREVVRVEGLIKELDKLEGRTDKQSRALRARLFKLERKLYAVDVMFYYKVIELLAGLADSAERVGHRLQILMAK